MSRHGLSVRLDSTADAIERVARAEGLTQLATRASAVSHAADEGTFAIAFAILSAAARLPQGRSLPSD